MALMLCNEHVHFGKGLETSRLYRSRFGDGKSGADMVAEPDGSCVVPCRVVRSGSKRRRSRDRHLTFGQLRRSRTKTIALGAQVVEVGMGVSAAIDHLIDRLCSPPVVSGIYRRRRGQVGCVQRR